MKSIRLWTTAIAFVMAAALVGTRAEQAPGQGGGATALAQVSGTPIDVNYEGANLRSVRPRRASRTPRRSTCA